MLSRATVPALWMLVVGLAACGDSGASPRKEQSRVFTVPSHLPHGAQTAPAEGQGGGSDGRVSQVFSRADRTSFLRLAAQLPGKEGLAISGVGRAQLVTTLGALAKGTAWSTSKTAVAMAVVAAGQGQSQKGNLERAITASDNAAAENLWTSLGGGERAARAADAQLRAAGDLQTQIEFRRLLPGYTAFGQTDWALRDQTRFVAGMGCTSAGTQVLRLMARVVPAQRWGLGQLPGAAIKGGWGPGYQPGLASGWMERQMALATIRRRRVAISLASTAPNHADGIRSLEAMTRWLVAHADVSGFPRTAAC
jgi:hypothetical protein